MRLGDGLFETFRPQIDGATTELYNQEQARVTIMGILGIARTLGRTASLVGYSQIWRAVANELEDTSICMPSGRMYSLPDYDQFTLASSSAPNDGSEDFDVSLGDSKGIEYISRLLILTDDKREKPKGSRLKNALEELLEDTPQETNNVGIIHLLVPKETSAISSLRSVTFSATMAKSGQSYFHTFTTNPNKGKVIPEAGLADSDGVIRDSYGEIDKNTFAAIRSNGAANTMMLGELEKALENAKKQHAEDEAKRKSKQGAPAPLARLKTVASNFRGTLFPTSKQSDSA